MKRLETAALAVIAMSTASVIAIAQTANPSAGSSSAGSSQQQQLSSTDCQKVWNEVNPQSKPGVSVSDVQSRLTDVKKVDTNGDNMITSAEFTSACQQGFVKQAAAGTGSTGSSTGASSGTSGSSGQSGSSTGSGSMGSGSSPSGSSTQPSR